VIAGGPGLAWDYLELPPSIANRITLVHLELAGTAQHSDDPSDYSRARDVVDVEALRAHLDADEVVVIGHSYGGFVALEYALAHPDRVAGLVLYDTSATSGPTLWAEIRANLVARADAPWFADAAAAFAAFPTGKTDDEVTALFRRAAPLYLHEWPSSSPALAAWLARVRISHARSHLTGGEPFDVVARLAELRMPTLVLVGASDFVCSPAMARVLADGIAEAELVVLDASGHFGHVEQPDAFADAVIAFVGRIARAAGTGTRM
jgi:pimeloyl-ACP methyl ester carboxylesterase